MNWYFVNAGQQAGPISDIQLDEYILAGKILPDTLIWREGMENWQPSQEVKSALIHKVPPSAVIRPDPNSSGETVLEIICAECGGVQPRDNAIKQGDRWICAACKPLHIQKIKEGVIATGTEALDYAGIIVRAVARLLDSIVIGTPTALLCVGIFLLGMPGAGSNKGSEETRVLLVILAMAATILGAVFLQIWCLAKYGGTPGKLMMHLRVVTADGGKISWGRAIGRFFAEWVTRAIPLLIGFLIAAFDPERRTVHDHIAGTRVIKV